MKIAISCKENSLNSEVSQQFGRAPYFAIYDLDTKTIEYINNTQTLNSASGAGIQAARYIVDSGAGALLSGHCGPKAFRTLHAGDINIYINVSGTVQEAIEKYKSGTLAPVKNADVEGHWL